MNKKLFLSLKIISGILLIYFGINQLNYIELYEFRLVENGISDWTYSPGAIRILVFIEFFIGSIMLIPINLKRLNIFLLTILIIVFVLDVICSFYHSLVLTEKYALTGSSVLILQIFSILILITTLILSYKAEKSDLKYKWIKFVLPVPIGVLVFAMAPIYIDDYLISDSKVEKAVLNWDLVDQYTNSENSLEGKKTLVAFFSSSCPHCNRMATMLSINNRINSPEIDVLIVMPGTDQEAAVFMDRNSCDIPYVSISNEEFTSFVGNTVPMIYLVNNKMEINRWSGQIFNLKMMDRYLGS